MLFVKAIIFCHSDTKEAPRDIYCIYPGTRETFMSQIVWEGTANPLQLYKTKLV